MNKPLIVPRVIVVGMFVFLVGGLLAAGSYVFETQVLHKTDTTPLFDLFSDAFKVGLGAFIGVLSQWANRVFKESDETDSPGIFPETATAPEVSAVPERLAAPITPSAPEIPAAPEMPADPELPAAPEMPADPELPAAAMRRKPVPHENPATLTGSASGD